MNTTTETTIPARCDYGVCGRRAVRVVEAGADRRGACATHAPRMIDETAAAITRQAMIRLYEIYTEATETAIAAGMTKDEAAAAVATWLDAQLDGGSR